MTTQHVHGGRAGPPSLATCMRNLSEAVDAGRWLGAVEVARMFGKPRVTIWRWARGRKFGDYRVTPSRRIELNPEVVRRVLLEYRGGTDREELPKR